MTGDSKSDPDYEFLTNQELQAWFPYHTSTTKMLGRLESDLKKASGLSILDFSILLYLATDPEHKARMSLLAEANGADPSTITYRVTRLEKKGWIVREPAPDDRRGVYAAITREGIATVRAAQPGFARYVRSEFLDCFTDTQLEQMGDIFRTLAIALDLLPAPHASLGQPSD